MAMNVIVRIFKSWGVRDPERRWANVYELHSGTATSPNNFANAMNAIVGAEKLLHLANVQFLSATISTWVEDSHPYNPSSFFTYDLSGTGAVGPEGGDPLDSNVVLLVKRQTFGGRSGKLYYRGCLDEGETIIGGDGRFQLKPTTRYKVGGSSWDAFLTAMVPLLTDSATPENGTMQLISKVGGVETARPVVSLKVGGVTINRRNHRYFDRAPAS